MIKEDLLYKHVSKSPPLQPFTHRCADTYQECQVAWNPNCLKKDALFYEFRTGVGGGEIELVPDACLNVLLEFDTANPRALFSGTFLRQSTLTLKPNTTYFGFKPYSNPGLKCQKIPLRDMVDSFTDFTDAFPGSSQLFDEMFLAGSFGERTDVFLRYAAGHLVDEAYSPTFVDYLAVMLCSAHGSIILANMGQFFGYSERYCREKFKDCYGMPPKQYSDIIRFQNTLKALFSGSCKDLCSLAVESGYFDQSHLTHDFRRYTNAPPEKYLKKYTGSS
ncbi:MAG: helix-turn-helix domain-containing protein [Clostridiales bacterium]|nr:helix-turn-helix domain-containing protein [Clostridiales bacterium]